MLRVRFHVDYNECHGDYRPVIWPINYPYWCTGETLNEYFSTKEFILVAYVDSMKDLKRQWPEAQGIDFADPVDSIVFTDRFPQPDWYQPETKQ